MTLVFKRNISFKSQLYVFHIQQPPDTNKQPVWRPHQKVSALVHHNNASMANGMHLLQVCNHTMCLLSYLIYHLPNLPQIIFTQIKCPKWVWRIHHLSPLEGNVSPMPQPYIRIFFVILNQYIFSWLDFSKVMKSSANQITVISYWVMEISEPCMKSLGTKAHQTKTKAPHPCESVDSWVNYKWIPKYWKNPSC